MANRIMLNQTSYHGAGAIQEIVNEAKAHGFKKAFVCSDLFDESTISWRSGICNDDSIESRSCI